VNLLLDECVPRPLKARLATGGHVCLTVPEAGFAGKTNGELLALAQGRFQVFITLDKGMPYQINLAGVAVAIIILRAKSNRRSDVLPFAPAILAAIHELKGGDVRIIEEP
jgi:predicted nuclease of predicted toxin-antitoxin system